MKVRKGPIYTSIDPGKGAQLQVLMGDQPHNDINSALNVTYLSPVSNLDGGFFAMPTPGSEVIVLTIEEGDGDDDSAVGHYYLGSVVGPKDLMGKCLDESKLLDYDLDGDPATYSQPGLITQDDATTLDQTTLGRHTKNPWGSQEGEKSYVAKEIVPERQVWEDPGGNVVELIHEQRIGSDAEQYSNYTVQLQTGRGKTIKMMDSPEANLIELRNGDQRQDVVAFCSDQPQSNDYSNGEFRVNTEGPVNLTSRARRVNVEVVDGYNITIRNSSTGDLDGVKGPSGTEYSPRVLGSRGGADATSGPQNTEYNTGDAANHDGAFEGYKGDPLKKGDENTGCINIVSDYNNINLSANYDDSVIFLNAPGTNSKIVVNTGGTVDVLAKGKITLTSDTKIEFNAPYIDLNSGERIDLD